MSRTFGPQFQDDGSVCFTVHALACDRLSLQIEGEHAQEIPMNQTEPGLFMAHVNVPAGTRYWYRVPDGNPRPDPASRFQPEGVHRPSELIDPRSYLWGDGAWKGIAKEAMVLYELHVGTFTQEGTYTAAIERLDELVELGVTAVELMPVAESAGRWNWGYDGTNFFAPRHTFGSPDELRQLIDAAHQKGLAMILDVVYNHFGAEGNYLHPFGGYVSPRHQTVWGDAPNLDSEDSAMMRDYIVANSRYWIEEFHFDGLRLDATHCIIDHSPRHIVGEIGDAFAEMQERLGRELHLIAESNIYDAQLLAPLDADGYGFDAVWCDDFLHAVAAELQPETHMSDRRYLAGEDIDTTLRRGYVFRGAIGVKRRRIPLSEDATPADWRSLIFSIQNHDFVGNHPEGWRLHQVTSHEAQRAAAALMLVLPAMPMLFMGEEFATDSPFYFFADFGDMHLREAVEQGRRREHPQHDWSQVVSCLSPAAFRKSKIGSREQGSSETWKWYRDLLRLRKQWQAAGILTGDHLTAAWDQLWRTALVTYKTDTQAGFAVVRLHPQGEHPEPLTVSIDGKVHMQQGCQTTGDGRFVLGDYAVLVGEGTVSFENR
ncbi:alpha-amylase family glycosyl hydrolase [Blastopirellula marina]|uniref:Malto-oligosyltrehalose trehalohydrolase n=1 Tax=Blastopirellula marina TaxID=124 RepID=A0A2S8FA28_9BACT|nr:alpha-amylase family glycosyl hydrolase [Blastopirellula marina]PQO28794.1 malto-oligosyltrehalose trehalohydrolase [Blastopirellula marina]PTL42067.1 malto-oligosyltrehalose trehalohydrolase [Blastopirellula marina]